MEETRDPQASTEGGGTPERDAEATSRETLSDIEASERVDTGGPDDTSGGQLETSTPRPDSGGAGRADGSETGGPM